MNRYMKSLVNCLVVALAISGTACGEKNKSVSAVHPWEALPADVIGVLHLDMQALFAADLFNSLGESFGVDAAAPLMILSQLEEATGFDPHRDLHSVTIGGTYDGNGEPGPYYVVVKGSFDVDKINAYAQGSPGAHTVEIDGIVTYETMNPTNPTEPSPAVAVLDETTLVAAAPGDLRKLIQSVAGKISTVADTPLADHIATSSDHAFLIIDVPEDALAAATGPSAGMFAAVAGPLNSIETVLVGLNATSNLDLSLSVLTDSEKNSEMVESTVQSFLAMGQMMGDENPEAAAMLSSLVVRRQGKAVSVSMQMTETQIQQAMETATPMVMAQVMPGATPDFPATAPVPTIPAPSVLPAESGDSAMATIVRSPSIAGVGNNNDENTNTLPATTVRTRPVGLQVQDDDFVTAVGKWVWVTNSSGLEMKAKLTSVGEDVLTFEQRVSGGAMTMTMQRAEIDTMRLVLPGEAQGA